MALLLAAGKLRRLAVQVRGDMHHIRQLPGALQALFFRDMANLHRKTDVLQRRHVWVQRIILKHKAHPAFFRRQGGDVFFVKQNAARRHRQNAGYHIQYGGFSAAGRPQQRGELAALQRDTQVVDGYGVTEPLCEML